MEEADALCNRVGIMVKGELRCIGSTQHLKNKYGGGYLLEIKRGKNMSNWDELHLAILLIFEDEKIKIEETFADRRIYSILQSAVTSLGEVFASLEKLKKVFNVEEYSFGQTTLEQVFLKFAKDQEIEEDHQDG